MSKVSTLYDWPPSQEEHERQAMIFQLAHEFRDVRGASDLGGPLTQAVRWMHSYYGTARLPRD